MVTAKNIHPRCSGAGSKNLIWLPEYTQSNDLKIQPWYEMSEYQRRHQNNVVHRAENVMRASNREMVVLKILKKKDFPEYYLINTRTYHYSPLIMRE
jgi:hypothetical protein